MSEKCVVIRSLVRTRNKESGLASTAKVFRTETFDHKIWRWGATWMSRFWGTVGWSLFNQGWFKSRAVSSRKQGHRVSTLGLATTIGLICRQCRMHVALRSTYPFFSPPALAEWRSASLSALPLVRRTSRYASARKNLRLASHPFCFSLKSRLCLSSIFLLAQLRGVFAVGILSLVSFSAVAGELVIDKQLKMIPKEQKAELSTEGGLQSEKSQPVVRDKRILDAAKMYEKYFLGQMMKAMRSTVNKSELEKPSMGEGIYREQLDDQYVDSWGERGGIGLADMIHDELVGKAEMMKLRRQAMRASKGKARTPMALTDRDVLTVRKLPSVKNANQDSAVETVLVSLGKTTSRPEDGPESVRSPWAGVVQAVRADNGKVIIEIRASKSPREPERQVELAYDGVPFEVTAGAVLQAGQVIGHLGKGARGILLRQTLVQAAKAPGTTMDSELGREIESE